MVVGQRTKLGPFNLTEVIEEAFKGQQGKAIQLLEQK